MAPHLPEDQLPDVLFQQESTRIQQDLRILLKMRAYVDKEEGVWNFFETSIRS